MMDFKYIVVCVILHLTYSVVEAISIHNGLSSDNFAEYDILDIIQNSRKRNRAMQRSLHKTVNGFKETKSYETLRFMKVHHGPDKRMKNEFTIVTSSSPALFSCNGTSVNQTAEIGATLTKMNGFTIISPVSASQVNTTCVIN